MAVSAVGSNPLVGVSYKLWKLTRSTGACQPLLAGVRAGLAVGHA